MKLVNCAECGREILGASMFGWYSKLDNDEKRKYSIVAGRILGRPYCNRCCETDLEFVNGIPDVVEEPNPWQENAIRQLEDTRDLGDESWD